MPTCRRRTAYEKAAHQARASIVSRRLAARFVHASAPLSRTGRGCGLLGCRARPASLVLAVAVPILFLHARLPAVGRHRARRHVGDRVPLRLRRRWRSCSPRWRGRAPRRRAPLRARPARSGSPGRLPRLDRGRGPVRPPARVRRVLADDARHLGGEVLRSTRCSPRRSSLLVAPPRRPAAAALVADALERARRRWSALAQFLGARTILLRALPPAEASFLLGYADFAALSVGVAAVGIVARDAAAARARAAARRHGARDRRARHDPLRRARLGARPADRRGGASPRSCAGRPASSPLGRARRAAVGRRGRRRSARSRSAATTSSSFARFLGSSPPARSSHERVQTLLAPDAARLDRLRIWRDHPLLGIGWQASAEPATFEAVPAGRRTAASRRARRSPSRRPRPAGLRRPGRLDPGARRSRRRRLRPLARPPSPPRALGRRCAALRAGARAAPAARAARSRALVWLWTAQGFFAGIPLDALTAVALGLAATRFVEAR